MRGMAATIKMSCLLKMYDGSNNERMASMVALRLMVMSFRQIKIIGVVFALVLLNACGGGGDAGDNNSVAANDGTVTDSQTGLTWQKGENEQVNWFQAMGMADLTFNPGLDDVCGSLELAGRTDWRVPTRRELVTIVDYAESQPAIDIIKFPGTMNENYWSSVVHESNSSLAWPIYFVDGSSFPDWANKGSLFRVRCVRGPTSLTPSYVDNSDGTVTDITSALMWQSQSDGTPRIWVDAISYCDAFVFASYSDWRLPSVDELLFIADQTRFLPAIDIAFFASIDSWYWSSTEIARNPAEAWPVLFTDGSMPNFVHFKSTAHHVRCVRDSGSSGGNTIPVANTGAHQKVTTGFLVTLDGGGSSDADGDTLIYNWSFNSAPTGSGAILSNVNAANPSFTADVDGLYVINLTVNDGIESSNVDTVIVIATPSTQPMILVDASKGGGEWWFPQGDDGTFDSDDQHQGKALADYLKSLGYTVIELPRFTRIPGSSLITTSTDLLTLFEIVIRSSGFLGYSPEEINAYHSYVSNGGSLLLLADHGRFVNVEQLALSFGISFEGISVGDNIIDTFETHPITAGVSSVGYGVGSGITEFPNTANILGYLSANTYVDLNDNNVQDVGEPVGAPVLGEMSFGAGKIIFSGDVNMWELVPQPLVDNSINWLAVQPPTSGLPLISIDVTPVNPTVTAGSTLQFAATGHFSDGSTQDVTTEVIWDSSIPSLITITNAVGDEGLASITSVDSAVITALDLTTGIVGGTTIWATVNHYLDLTSVNLNSLGTSIEVAPNNSITLTADYTMWSRSGCPGCIDWIAVGIEGDGQDAFNVGIPGVFPGASGSASFTLTAPNVIGTYGIYTIFAPDFTKSDALSRYELSFPDERLIRIGTINVQ